MMYSEQIEDVEHKERWGPFPHLADSSCNASTSSHHTDTAGTGQGPVYKFLHITLLSYFIAKHK